MATTVKMTKRDYYTRLLMIDAVQADTGMVEFINHELELLAKKSASSKGNTTRKPTAQQIANAGIKDRILAMLAENPNRIYSATEIAKAMSTEADEVSTSRASALLSQLVKNNEVTKVTEKRKSYFQHAEPVEGGEG